MKKGVSFPEVSIISSLYHKKRLQKIVSKLDLKAIILAAEEILIAKNEQNDEVKKYLNSMEYRRKILLEWVLRVCLLLDSKQSMIRVWRWFSYRR